MSTVALTLVTWNRASILRQAAPHTFDNAGRKWDEFIHLDNGSVPDQRSQIQQIIAPYKPTCEIYFSENTGMHRGWNTAMAMTRSDYLVALAPDEIMPDGWLDTFMTYVESIPDTGIATMYDIEIEKVPERYRNGVRGPEIVNGLPILRAMPMGIFIFKRSLFAQTGYWREDFGLYGWGDVEWAQRLERILPTVGHQWYVIPNKILRHLCSDGQDEFRLGIKPNDVQGYTAWKQKESSQASNHEVMDKARKANWPYYSPF